jgi:glutamate-1-semialdehyde 2,1-aminomutase/spore coat polysaccharide biosynthesis protein SpsF
MSIAPHPTTPGLARTQELLARARKLIPGASQTLSKGPTQWAQGFAPAYLCRGDGARVQDVDGRWYLDLPMALGPVLLGYRYSAVDDAIRAQLEDGITFTLPHPLELEVAERIAATVPNVERVRFGKSGSDVTSAAIRLARAVTGRERILAAGYHGWHDWYIGSTSWHAGVPAAVRELTEVVAWGNLEDLRAALARRPREVAAVILEPAGAFEPAAGYLQEVVDIAHEHGALAVFDEVITGFRLAPGGAQERYSAAADLVCFGKALGNGMPISALAGRAAAMDALEHVFFSGTHAGDALSLAAARATLDVIATHPVHDRLWHLGGRLQEGVKDAVARHGLEDWVSCGGAPPWTIVTVREPHPGRGVLPAKTLLQQEMLRQGVLYNGSNFISFSHGESEIDEALDAYDHALAVLAEALPDEVEGRLQAPPVSRVFRSIS